MHLEKELLDAFNKVVHEDFPNPQRIDCPGRNVLFKLAQQPADAQLSHLLNHVRRCTPYFDELKNLRSEVIPCSSRLSLKLATLKRSSAGSSMVRASYSVQPTPLNHKTRRNLG
jgi:hypothetical protein